MSEQEKDEEHKVKGERGAGSPSVVEELKAGQSLGKMGLVAVITLGGVGFLYASWQSDDEKQLREETRKASIAASVPFTPAPPPPVEEKHQPDIAQVATAEIVHEPVKEETNEMLEASMRAPVIAFSANINQSRHNQETEEFAGANFAMELPEGVVLGNQQPDRLRDRLQTTPLEGVKASLLPNLHMVVPQGTQIPCTLQTAVSSDQPGMVSCVVQRDILSASGQVVLMEKGTSIVGEYNGGLRQGQKRIFVLWNRARTPNGVIVNLGSPATDGLGRAGFDGKIDTHFWERFGGAILMSIISDASNYGFSQLRDGNRIDTRETESAARDVAAIALENSINIPPTLYKNHGDSVSIFVARDLDFSDVYDLKTIETTNQIYDRAVTGDMRPKSPIISK